MIGLWVAWVIVAVSVHIAGERQGWYGRYWWFDHVTHALSGGALMLGIGLVTANPYVAWTAFFTGAVAWEIGEYLYGESEELWHSVRNMAYDLVFGVLAALVVWSYLL